MPALLETVLVSQKLLSVKTVVKTVVVKTVVKTVVVKTVVKTVVVKTGAIGDSLGEPETAGAKMDDE